MKAFLDTSVLVAAFYGDHEHHDASIELFLRYRKHEACCAAHSLAEVFASLTGMPGKYRATPDQATLFLGNIRDKLTLVALSEAEYFEIAEASAVAGVTGGSIYDAVQGHCALKAGARTIYTWNVKHFRRLGPEIAKRVATP